MITKLMIKKINMHNIVYKYAYDDVKLRLEGQ